MATYACVLSFQSLSAPGTQTVSGVVDAQTGAAFTPVALLPLGGYADSLNALCTSTSTWHMDMGLHHWGEGKGGAAGCGAFQYNHITLGPIKVCSGADATGYALMDTLPFLFFGGMITGTGYVSAVRSGEFDVTWVSATRASYRTVLVLGGTDWDLKVHTSIVNGTQTTASKARGVLWLNSLTNYGSGLASATGAGARTMGFGFDVDGSNRGCVAQVAVSQGPNYRTQLFDRIIAEINQTTGAISTGSPTVSAWGGTSGFTISGATGALSSKGLSFSGADVQVASGRFTVPASDGSFSVNLGLGAKFVILMGVGAASSGAVRSDQASICLGWTDGSAQHSFWTGEAWTTIGVPLVGGRYLSTSSLWRMATPSGGTTAFSNVLTLTNLSTALGTMTLSASSTDGTSPEVLWFAVGAATSGGTGVILKADQPGVGVDDGEMFLSYIVSGAFKASGRLSRMAQLREPVITGRETDATVQATLIKDFGLSSPSDTVVMTGVGETHVSKRVEGLQEADMRILQVKLGDQNPTADYWSIDKFTGDTDPEGESS